MILKWNMECHILGPAYFTTNMAYMSTMINSDSELFADDKTTFEIDSSIDYALTRLQKSIHKVKSYTLTNSLTVHSEKCEILIISRSPFIGQLQTFPLIGRSSNLWILQNASD